MVGIDNKSVHIFKSGSTFVQIITYDSLSPTHVRQNDWMSVFFFSRTDDYKFKFRNFGCNKEMIIGLSLESITINLGYMLVTRNLRLSIFWPVEKKREHL